MSTTITPKASPSPSPTVTPAELGQFLDAVASAPVALRDVPRMNHILARLVGLANSKHPIGELVPSETSHSEHDEAAAVAAAVADGRPC